jgi:hypothetical protein
MLASIAYSLARRTSDARAGSTRRTYSSNSRASNASRSTILRASHHVDEFSGNCSTSGRTSREATTARCPSSAIVSGWRLSERTRLNYPAVGRFEILCPQLRYGGMEYIDELKNRAGRIALRPKEYCLPPGISHHADVTRVSTTSL